MGRHPLPASKAAPAGSATASCRCSSTAWLPYHASSWGASQALLSRHFLASTEGSGTRCWCHIGVARPPNMIDKGTREMQGC
eukprot:680992-Pyramimonas_sp.AAC.1